MSIETLPYKSRTQVRDFSTFAVYRSAIDGAVGQVFNDNIQLAQLADFRRIAIFANIPMVPHELTVTVCHNVRAYCRKEAVEFVPFIDQYGVEMILVKVLGELKGYAEPCN